MGPKTTELLSILEELRVGLSATGQDHWSQWISESARRLKASDFSGIEHLLRAYGGMGSINDLMLSPDLARLRTDAYDLAEDIRKQVSSG
ncbi:MAG: hypothetical protein P1V35_09320 [Planctomycetota bacterium]|nr:hypothetical protein [Planctomycetota bacterium]